MSWLALTPGAYFDGALGEILPYDTVRDAAEPDAGLLDFQSTTLQAIQQRWRLAAGTAWRWNLPLLFQGVRRLQCSEIPRRRCLSRAKVSARCDSRVVRLMLNSYRYPL